MLAAFILIMTAALNRIRGDRSLLPTWAQGRALWYVSPAIGLVAFTRVGALTAGAVAIAYLIWAAPAWGRWYDLGRLPALTDRKPDAFEAGIEFLAGDRDHAALWLRFAVTLAPGLAVVGLSIGEPAVALAALPMAVLMLAVYEASWRFAGWYAIPVAELLAGAVWGLLILSF